MIFRTDTEQSGDLDNNFRSPAYKRKASMTDRMYENKEKQVVGQIHLERLAVQL